MAHLSLLTPAPSSSPHVLIQHKSHPFLHFCPSTPSPSSNRKASISLTTTRASLSSSNTKATVLKEFHNGRALKVFLLLSPSPGFLVHCHTAPVFVFFVMLGCWLLGPCMHVKSRCQYHSIMHVKSRGLLVFYCCMGLFFSLPFVPSTHF